MTKDTLGWIIVRVALKDTPKSFELPQSLYSSGHKSKDAEQALDVTLFPDPQVAEVMRQRCKLSRPESCLELRRCKITVEVLAL